MRIELSSKFFQIFYSALFYIKTFQLGISLNKENPKFLMSVNIYFLNKSSFLFNFFILNSYTAVVVVVAVSARLLFKSSS